MNEAKADSTCFHSLAHDSFSSSFWEFKRKYLQTEYFIILFIIIIVEIFFQICFEIFSDSLQTEFCSILELLFVNYCDLIDSICNCLFLFVSQVMELVKIVGEHVRTSSRACRYR